MHSTVTAATAADTTASRRRNDPRDMNTNEEAQVLNWKVVCWSLGTSAAVSFVLCVLWGLITPQALHMHAFLEQVLPAFKWLTLGGFVLGLVESFLFGFYVGAVYTPLHNFFSKRFGRQT